MTLTCMIGARSHREAAAFRIINDSLTIKSNLLPKRARVTNDRAALGKGIKSTKHQKKKEKEKKKTETSPRIEDLSLSSVRLQSLHHYPQCTSYHKSKQYQQCA